MSDANTIATSKWWNLASIKQKLQESLWLWMVLLMVVTISLFAAAGQPGKGTIRDRMRHGDKASAMYMHSCAWKSLGDHQALLNVSAIPRAEFLRRQKSLMKELQAQNIDVLVTEPSATSAYYFNVSAKYDLSERPFLIMLDTSGQVSYLLPRFEENRLRNLRVVAEQLRVIAWKEEESPYNVFVNKTTYRKVMVDEALRHMIVAGLQQAGISISPLSDSIKRLRAVKSQAEVAILSAINTFTLEILRSLQPCVTAGTTQDAVSQALRALYTRVGLEADHWAIVLFGSQAANPHGGSLGHRLAENELFLIDTGTTLHGYGSDVTRTMLPKNSEIADDLFGLWYVVLDAQTAAIHKMKVNETCSDIDAVARKVITDAYYGKYFTHRLGHGLGLEMHEHPYLNGANNDKLFGGEVATCEPGIYVTDIQAKELGLPFTSGFGIRIEDPVLVGESGPVLLTGSRASSPWSP